MDELNFSSGDNESRIPRRFRDVVFWEHPIIEDYQVYTDLLFCGWWYRLRPTTPFDDSCPASGFQIEAFVYGEKSPRCNLADLQIFDSLTSNLLRHDLCLLLYLRLFFCNRLIR